MRRKEIWERKETRGDAWGGTETRRHTKTGATVDKQTKHRRSSQQTSGRPRDVPSHVSHVSMSWTEIVEIRAQPGENKTKFGRRPGDLTIQRAPPHLQTDARCGRVGDAGSRGPSRAGLPCVGGRVDSTSTSPRCFSAHNCTNNCALRDENIVLRNQKEFFECTHSIENVVQEIMSVVAGDDVCEVSYSVENVRL